MSDPRDPLTVQQIVRSAYQIGDWYGTGPIMNPEDCTSELDGDPLLAFLLAETSPDGDDPDSLDHWLLARARMETVLREVQSVYEALHRFGPSPVP
jgi:hypothetical protein